MSATPKFQKDKKNAKKTKPPILTAEPPLTDTLPTLS
jgi:hypothetical protein